MLNNLILLIETVLIIKEAIWEVIKVGANLVSVVINNLDLAEINQDSVAISLGSAEVTEEVGASLTMFPIYPHQPTITILTKASAE